MSDPAKMPVSSNSQALGLTDEEVLRIREDFPILQHTVHGKSLIYLDNNATTQKPIQVLDAMRSYYETQNANPNRGAHELAIMATNAYEAARRDVAIFLHAYRVREIIFMKGATEALNLLAYSLGLEEVEAGDEIILSILEHHANIVPWQMVAKAKGASLKYLYLDENGSITPESLREIMTSRTKIISLTGSSNVTGERPDLPTLFQIAREINPDVYCIADLAQLVPHTPVDVRELGCDFAAFSSHKIYAGMGHGVLWGKFELLRKLKPFLLGGDMIVQVTEQTSTFQTPAQRFEAGTQHVEGAIGLAAAIAYVKEIGLERIDRYEHELGAMARSYLLEMPEVELFSAEHSTCVAFNVKGVHPHDVSTILDRDAGIAIRSGHHCAEPLHHYLGQAATCRASFSFYNTREEVMHFVRALQTVPRIMGLS